MLLSKKTLIAHLKADKAFTKVPNKYANFANVFLSKLVTELPEYTEINNHTIKLIDNEQLPYGLIYSLRPVKLEMLKIYLKNNLVNSSIRFSKSLFGVPIFFDKKLDRSLRLFVDYQGLNNLTIKNRYPLSLVDESLDLLGWPQRFTQLDLTNTYH